MEFQRGPAQRPLPRLSEEGLVWRAMAAADLDAVVDIAAVGFPDHFEGRDCFANRLTLNPSGCFVLADGEGAPQGYLIAYPWRAGDAPALNTLIEAVPDDASGMYLHDLALDLTARGGDRSRVIVERLAEDARAAGWTSLALIAVNDAAPFWERRGFTVVDKAGMADKLAGYGPGARYMVRDLNP